MLFTAKRNVATALGVGAVIVLVAVVSKTTAGLTWSLQFTPPTLALGLAGVGLLLLSDGLVHLVLWHLVGEPYRDTYRALAEYFDGQSVWAIAAGGLLAGGEELLFRGVVLQGAVELRLLPTWPAVAVAGVLFGAAHVIPKRRLRSVSLWAVWEGLLLGTLYVATGSLLVAMIAHVLHDIAGFALFARDRDATRGSRRA